MAQSLGGTRQGLVSSTCDPTGLALISESMGTFDSTGNIPREVKFLDRSVASCGEGVFYQRVLVCRSRTRVWGAKMIRYRCSPKP